MGAYTRGMTDQSSQRNASLLGSDLSLNSSRSPRGPIKEISATYKDRHAEFSRASEKLQAKGRKVENLRGLTFAGLVIGAGYYFAKDGQSSQIGLLVALVCGAAFLWLVQHHGKVLAQEAHQRRFSLVNEHGLQRVEGDWHSLPRTGSNFAPQDHGYAEDLDLFGVGSLYQRISVAHTRYGQKTLASWLGAPASHNEIQERQKAVSELSPQVSFRQNLEAEGMALVEKRRGGTTTISDGPNPERLLQWAASPGKIDKNVFIQVFSYLIPLLSMGGIYAHSALNASPLLWIVPIVLGMVLLNLTKEPTSNTFAAVSTTEGAFLRYGALLELLENQKVESPWLKKRLESLLGKSKARPSEVMRRFRTLVSWYDLRHNGMVYPFVNAILLWDIHCTRALEKWKKEAGNDLPHFFEIIGEYEAISSLAGLHADEPSSNFPEVLDPKRDPASSIEARSLGHPLLGGKSRVVNQVQAFSLGQALLITGSNMSGKSTFLRALGVNCVLAFAGGPTVSEYMKIPLCNLGTSIRVSDSLKSGVSHFYAEVQKLAHVVKLTETSELPTLFLLDEVLHGTNSRERQIGARWVLGELLKKGAFGVITTHDMGLCQLPEHLMSNVRQHHFRESVRNGEMTFDYTLREGPVTSGNALRLMQRVGLMVPLDENEAEAEAEAEAEKDSP